MLKLEVGKKSTTTPQEPTKFKVGDRVRARGDEIIYLGTILTYYPEDMEYVVNVDGLAFALRFKPHELEHLADTPTTPSLVQCSCNIHVIMRDGCKCGCAREEIEQEFKQRGWK